MTRALSALLVLGVVLVLFAFGTHSKPPFVKFKQLGKMEGDVYVNRSFVMQIRRGLDYGDDSMIVFSSGTFLEVHGTPSETEAKLED